MELLGSLPQKVINKIKNECRKNGLVSIFEQYEKWDCNENRVLDCSKTIDIIYANLSPFDAELFAYVLMGRLHSLIKGLYGIKFEACYNCKDDFVNGQGKILNINV